VNREPNKLEEFPKLSEWLKENKEKIDG